MVLILQKSQTHDKFASARGSWRKIKGGRKEIGKSLT